MGSGSEVVLMSIKEAARKLGVSAFTVRRHIAAGRLPHVIIGGRVLLRSTDVQRAQEEGIPLEAQKQAQ